jgi:hypothetical protein
MAWVSLNQRVLVVLRGFVIRDTHPSETPTVLLHLPWKIFTGDPTDGHKPFENKRLAPP